jgi:hypothetical protein
MTSLLISEPPLQVLPSLAVQIGLGEAIILQQIHYWSLRSKQDEDGHFWVYNTVAKWQEQFPFWCKNTIAKYIKNLRDSGYLIAEMKSNNTFDKTLFYRIDYEKIGGVSIHQDLGNRETKPRGISNKTETTREFDTFWGVYPKKVAKGAALKAWSKIRITDELLSQILGAIDRQKKAGAFADLKFVPYPATWLNDCRWLDDVAAGSSASANHLPDWASKRATSA